MDLSARGNFLAQEGVDAPQREGVPKGCAEMSEEGMSTSLPDSESNLELVVVICAGTMVTLRTHREKSSNKGSVYSEQ